MGSLLCFLKANGCVDESNQKIIAYGIEKISGCIEDFLITVLISKFYGMVFEGMVYQLAFMLLRIYAGGYHASTRRKCSIISILCTIGGLSVIRFMKMDVIILLLAFIGWYGIFINAPVESENKPLNGNEKKIYKRRTRIIATAFLIICIWNYWINCKISEAFVVAMFTVYAGIVLAKITRK